MAFIKQSGRQDVLSAVVNINLADLVSGVALDAVAMPGGAIVVGGHLAKVEDFNSGTSDVVVVAGPSGEALIASASVATGEGTALPIVPTGTVATAPGHVTVTNTRVGTAATTGKLRLVVNYIIAERAMISQD